METRNYPLLLPGNETSYGHAAQFTWSKFAEFTTMSLNGIRRRLDFISSEKMEDEEACFP